MAKYYDLEPILSKKCQYNVIWGERSNGKTYGVLKHGIKEYVKHGGQIAYIRRWGEDFKGITVKTLFEALVANNEISKITKGEWTHVYYYGRTWYLAREDEVTGKLIKDTEPFCYGFALTEMERTKGSSFPNIRTVLFDEFLTRPTAHSGYLPDEFILFQNVLSTIIRQRKNVTIFMLGNTVNKYCPYFKEMGLNHAKTMKQGTIDIYTYDKGLRVAAEYCSGSESKESDTYFAFDNPKLKMVTSGAWEMDIHPHLPYKYRPKDVIYSFFIIFDGEQMKCEIINVEDDTFIYVHRHTTEVKDNPDTLIYKEDWSPKPNHRRNIYKQASRLEQKIANLFALDKVFYQDNELGELMMNYLNWCKTI